VVIGAKWKWGDVYKKLEAKGLAIAGGRNSEVGVRGLTLGGGLPLFSPRFGMVCSNIIECEIVLADGEVATASATKNPYLWRVLSNFGIVTRFSSRIPFDEYLERISISAFLTGLERALVLP
jgi:FAD/FMN-containing dehydrogenase